MRIRTKKWNLMTLLSNNKNKLIVFITFLLCLYISTYWLQFMFIQGTSMDPTYKNMQLTVLEKHCKVLKPGNVIAFKSESLKTLLVKRIVAVPGDCVHIKEGKLFINGSLSTLIPETSYLEFSGIADESIRLLEDEYFVLGDNFQVSKDSRYEEIGCIKRKDIIGKVLPQRSLTNEGELK